MVHCRSTNFSFLPKRKMQFAWKVYRLGWNKWYKNVSKLNKNFKFWRKRSHWRTRKSLGELKTLCIFLWSKFEILKAITPCMYKTWIDLSNKIDDDLNRVFEIKNENKRDLIKCQLTGQKSIHPIWPRNIFVV